MGARKVITADRAAALAASVSVALECIWETLEDMFRGAPPVQKAKAERCSCDSTEDESRGTKVGRYSTSKKPSAKHHSLRPEMQRTLLLPYCGCMVKCQWSCHLRFPSPMTKK